MRLEKLDVTTVLLLMENADGTNTARKGGRHANVGPMKNAVHVITCNDLAPVGKWRQADVDGIEDRMFGTIVLDTELPSRTNVSTSNCRSCSAHVLVWLSGHAGCRKTHDELSGCLPVLDGGSLAKKPNVSAEEQWFEGDLDEVLAREESALWDEALGM